MDYYQKRHAALMFAKKICMLAAEQEKELDAEKVYEVICEKYPTSKKAIMERLSQLSNEIPGLVIANLPGSEEIALEDVSL